MDRLEDAKNSLTMAEQEMERLPASLIKALPDAGLLHAEIMVYEKKWEKANPLIEKLERELVAVPGPDAWSEAVFQLEPIAKLASRIGD